jgi:hypothetical protein
MAQNEMTDLTTRTERLVNAISGALLSSVEVAAERIGLAAEVARVTQRMSAFAAVLDAIGVQKDALAAKLTASKGSMRLLIRRQIELLTAQEAAVLERTGAPMEAVRVAIETTDAPLYRRQGKRFERLADAQQTVTPAAVGENNRHEAPATTNGPNEATA